MWWNLFFGEVRIVTHTFIIQGTLDVNIRNIPNSYLNDIAII